MLNFHLLNFKKLTKSKKIVLILFVLLILLSGGIFLWQKKKGTEGSVKDFVIRETAEGVFVENKKAGLSVEAPEGWEVEKVELEPGAINFNSPNMQVVKKDGQIILPIEQGCKIQSSVGYEKLNLIDLQIELRYSFALAKMKSTRFEEIVFNDYPAIKTFFGLEENDIGTGMSLSVLSPNKIYGFSVMWANNEKEECIQEFNKFLEKVNIK